MPRRNNRKKIFLNLSEVRNNTFPLNSVYINVNDKQIVVRSTGRQGQVLSVRRISVDSGAGIESLKSLIEQAHTSGKKIIISPEVKVNGVWPPFVPKEISGSIIEVPNIKGARKGKRR